MDESFLLEKLRSLRIRYRKVLILRRMMNFLVIASLTSLLASLLFKVFGFGAPLINYSLIPVALAVVIPVILFLIQKVSLMKVALLADERLLLKERLSTLLEWIEERKKRTLMFKGLLKDSSASIKAISARSTFPFTFQKRDRALFAALPLLIIMLLTPPWGFIPLSQGYEDNRAVALIARKLQDEAHAMETRAAAAPESREEIRKKAAEVRKLAKDLKTPGISKKEAIAKISSLSDKYRQPGHSKAKATLEKMLNAASGSQNRTAEDKRALSDRLREMAKKCRNPATADRDMSRIQQETGRMKDAAEDRSTLRKGMEEAISHMKKGERQAAAEKLNKAADEIEKMERAAQSLKSAEDLCTRLSSCKNALSGDSESASEEISQTGQNDGTTPGQDMEPGSRGSGGKGEAKETGEITKNYKVTEKEGHAEADFGKGTTNKEQKENKTPRKSLLKRQSERQSHWKEFYEKLYESRRDRLDSATTRVRGKSSGLGGTLSTSEQKGGIPVISPQGAAPSALYSEYRGKAEEAVSREKIPGEYRKLVKSYFKEIDPSR